MQITYRKLTVEDAESYLRLRIKAIDENPKSFASSPEEARAKSADQIKDQLALNEQYDHFILGAFQADQLCGMVGFNRFTHEKMKHKGSLWGVYVSAEYQGKGIAKGLMRKALELIHNLDGVEQVNLMVNTENEKARKLYLSLGFTVYGIEKRAMKIDGVYYDEELMAYFFER